MTKFTQCNLFKSIVLSLIAVLFLSSVYPSLTHASSTNFKTEDNNIEVKMKELSQFTKEDILSLEKYVFVDNNGYFKLDEEKAITDGVSTKLLEGQRNYFDNINSDIQKGLLQANENLEIEIKDSAFTILGPNLEEKKYSTLSSCKGVTTSPKAYWWGQSRKLNSCDANRFSANMYSLAAGYGTPMAVIGFWFPGFAIAGAVSAGYFSVVASRVDAHNSKGRGVKVDVTWALAFSVNSQ